MIKWAFVFVCSLIGLYFGYDNNVHQLIIENDMSYLSWVIISLWSIASVSIGKRNYLNDWSEWPDLHFASDAMVSLGMIGTVIGFIYTLSGSFTNLDPTNLDSFREVLVHMSSGIGTALWTTLVGLVFSLNLKLQLIVSET